MKNHKLERISVLVRHGKERATRQERRQSLEKLANEIEIAIRNAGYRNAVASRITSLDTKTGNIEEAHRTPFPARDEATWSSPRQDHHPSYWMYAQPESPNPGLESRYARSEQLFHCRECGHLIRSRQL